MLLTLCCRIAEKEMSPNEVRRCKWLRAASLDMGKLGVMPRLVEASMECLAEWTPEFLADFVVRLTSAVAGYSWESFDGKPTMGDQIMAGDNAWQPNESVLDGWAMPAMNAICKLIPIGFSIDCNFEWFNEKLAEAHKPLIEEEKRMFTKYCMAEREKYQSVP